MCLVYDGFKDLYKVFADGEKIDSGTWTGDGVFEPARFNICFDSKCFSEHYQLYLTSFVFHTSSILHHTVMLEPEILCLVYDLSMI